MTSPNILIFMVDQLNGTLFPDGPAEWLRAPNLKKLAARSTRFKNAYTASPLCAPGRASFMSGQLPSATRVYDNAAEFASSIPTYAHHLRRAGYQTCLSGKMHFVGPDQLHGFEERLTTDIYPPDFGWTPDYRKPGERIDFYSLANPSAVDRIGTLAITGNSDIAVQGSYLYADRNRDLVIYDISDPAEARLVGTLPQTFETAGSDRVASFNNFNGGNSFGGADGCATDGCDVSTASDDNAFGTGGTDPLSGVPVMANSATGGSSSGGSGSSNAASGGSNVDVPRDGTGGSLARFLVVANRLYCIDDENLIVFDITNPAAPKELGSKEVDWMIETIFYANAHLFIAGRNGLTIYDVDDNKMPEYRGEFDHAERCDPVYVDGDRAYVTLRGGNDCGGWTNQVDILDVSNVRNPILLTSYMEVDSPYGLAVKNGKAIVCDGPSGLRILDVSDPFNITECKRYGDLEAIDVIWHGNLLIVNTGKDFYLYDASNPCALKEYGVLFRT